MLSAARFWIKMNPELVFVFFVFFKPVWWCVKSLSLPLLLLLLRLAVCFFFPPLFALKKRWRNHKTNAEWNSRIPLCCKEGKPVPLNKNKSFVSTVSGPPVGLPRGESCKKANGGIFMCLPNQEDKHPSQSYVRTRSVLEQGRWGL